MLGDVVLVAFCEAFFFCEEIGLQPLLPFLKRVFVVIGFTPCGVSYFQGAYMRIALTMGPPTLPQSRKGLLNTNAEKSPSPFAMT